ncbi:MAG TPA: hypothetical protein PL110_18475, partial [Candidatus Eremiobacteraeota bacterium]|nr:hypothetical protein [Candidatus Eremiobacteraeota bacterium]
PSGNQKTSSNLPNIYYIILDGYARSDIHKEIYKYDNSELINYLKEKKFYIASKSRSNYCYTNLSLPSSLNFMYLDDIISNTDNQFYKTNIINYHRENNRVFRFLKTLGYKTIIFYTGNTSVERINSDIILCPMMPINEFQWSLISYTPLEEIIGKHLFSLENLHRHRVLYCFDNIPDTTDMKSPFIVFAHILCPHPPFVFGENGEKVNNVKINFFDATLYRDEAHETQEEYIEKYRNQSKFTSKKIIKTIDDILTRSNTLPIIIIQADHGSGAFFDETSLENANLKERFSILNAYYFPNNNYKHLYDTITPVNSFRVIFNTYFNCQYKLLKDKNYYSTTKDIFNFIDVTDKIDNKKTTVELQSPEVYWK